MAKFLNTSATTYYLEELIKQAKERLWLISPYLKFNDRIKELLEDKNRMKIDIRIVYGKANCNRLKPIGSKHWTMCEPATAPTCMPNATSAKAAALSAA